MEFFFVLFQVDTETFETEAGTPTVIYIPTYEPDYEDVDDAVKVTIVFKDTVGAFVLESLTVVGCAKESTTTPTTTSTTTRKFNKFTLSFV